MTKIVNSRVPEAAEWPATRVGPSAGHVAVTAEPLAGTWAVSEQPVAEATTVAASETATAPSLLGRFTVPPQSGTFPGRGGRGRIRPCTIRHPRAHKRSVITRPMRRRDLCAACADVARMYGLGHARRQM